MLTHEDVRRIALSMPEAYEAPHFESASFRVNTKIFCTLSRTEPRMMLKFDPEDQRNLVADNPEVIWPVPGYWGQKGATYLCFPGIEDARLTDLMRMAWARVAPKRLLA
ncbi:MmcQ/YjbR family DNA-binding protein [Phenylobacterium sp.]|uniref:MmcQ/YjbR family DNA-binding protein n=1 Tax=Phenylobacterium sp. TaxID=1871053 RepID=UPI002DEDB14B|nr:MmcQ/YjbR family DNA-binding protein [Phenylobacterium sp.]